MNKQELFSNYYETNYWQGQQSRSGPGSDIEATINIRRVLPILFEGLKIQSILDAPCGDYNWFRLMLLPERIKYTGGDIVPQMIEKNHFFYGNYYNRSFELLDITERLVDADLWLCRDCFQHLSFEDIFKSIELFKKSNIKYLLTTTHSLTRQSQDIKTGNFRYLNLELLPFNFPEPLLFISDNLPKDSPYYGYHDLALWERQQLSNMQLTFIEDV
jgi:hypothetical protein